MAGGALINKCVVLREGWVGMPLIVVLTPLEPHLHLFLEKKHLKIV